MLIIFCCFNFSKKLRRKLAGREHDADTDSYSDTEFDPNQEADIPGGLTAEERLKKTYNNLELLEKRFGKLFKYFSFDLKYFVVWDDMKVIFIKFKNGKLWYMSYRDEILLDWILIHMYVFKLMIKNDIQVYKDRLIHRSSEK